MAIEIKNESLTEEIKRVLEKLEKKIWENQKKLYGVTDAEIKRMKRLV